MKNCSRNLVLTTSLLLSAFLAGCGYTPAVGDARPGVPVAADFLGLSIEWCNAQTVLGQTSTGGR